MERRKKDAAMTRKLEEEKTRQKDTVMRRRWREEKRKE